MHYANADWRSAAWTASFEEAAACQRLDDELEKLCWNLRRHASSLEKTLRARVLRWVSKFESEKESPALVWKKGRNAHARALLAGLRRGRLPPPFDAGPPAGLPLGAALPVACAAAVGLNAAGEWAKSKKSWKEEEEERLVLLFRKGNEEGEEEEEEQGEHKRATRSSKGRKRPVVAGTALPLAPPLSEAAAGSKERRRGEKERTEAETSTSSSSSSSFDPFSSAHLPSRVELAASLGAATERIAELEWRLAEGERRARAREWEAGVAAARAASALLAPSTSASTSSAVEDGEEEEGKERKNERRASPPRRAPRTPGGIAAAAFSEKKSKSKSRRRAEHASVPFLAPSPRAATATATPLLRARSTKGAAVASTPLQQTAKRKLKLPEKQHQHQQQKIPTVSLEEISRRIAALAPQHKEEQRSV